MTADTRMTTVASKALPAPYQNLSYRDQQITLKSCYGKTNYTLRLEPCQRGNSGRFHGVLLLSDEQKRQAQYVVEPGKTFVKIQDGTTFDLTKFEDVVNWEWVKLCPQIAGGRQATDYRIKGEVKEAEDFKSFEGGDMEFYVHDEDREAEADEYRYSQEFKALEYIHDQSNTSIYQVARLLGSNMENSKPRDVRNFLISKAQKHPAAVLKVEADGSSKPRLFLYSALDKEVIRKRAGVYYYNDIAIGTTEDQVLLWLSEDRNFTLVRAISLEIMPAASAPRPVVSEANQALFESFGAASSTGDESDGTDLGGDEFDDDEPLGPTDLDPNATTPAAPLTRGAQLAAARAAKAANAANNPA